MNQRESDDDTKVTALVIAAMKEFAARRKSGKNESCFMAMETYSLICK